MHKHNNLLIKKVKIFQLKVINQQMSSKVLIYRSKNQQFKKLLITHKKNHLLNRIIIITIIILQIFI